VISTSEKSISVSVDKKHNLKINNIIEELNKIAYVNIIKDMAVVSIICDSDKTSKILGLIFNILNKNNIKVEMISKGISKINISLIISNSYLANAINIIHTALFN
jgi:aspartate kinase